MLFVLLSILLQFLLLFPQSFFRLSISSDLQLNLDFTLILVIYISMSFRFWSGFFSVALVSLLLETFTQLPVFYVFMPYMSLFLLMRFFTEEIYSEAYLTKALWVIPSSFLANFLLAFNYFPDFNFISQFNFWLQLLSQSLLNSMSAFILFIVFDFYFDQTLKLFNRKRAQITGVDFLHTKNPDRKFY